MKKRFFRPDIAFGDIYLITPEVLSDLGIKGLVFDIDNTIAPYEVEEPTSEMLAYFRLLKEAGIKMAFVSNNHSPRVELFNKNIGLFYVCEAGKPSPKGVIKCIEHLGLDKNEVMAVGDQIFTDCMAAHRAGIRFAMVKPIQPKESLFFRIKRYFEKPFVNGVVWIRHRKIFNLRKNKKTKKDRKLLKKRNLFKERKIFKRKLFKLNRKKDI